MSTPDDALIRRPRRGRVVERLLGASGIGLVGSGVVFGMMILMNDMSSAPPKPEEEARTRFALAPKPPPPRRPKPKPKPRKREARAKRSSAAPPPALGSSVSAASFAMPGFSPTSVQSNERAILGDVRPGVMTEDAVDARPVPRERVSAKYPPRARAMNVQGFVRFNILINERGQVERIKLLESKPPGVFDQAARETLRQWSFQPAMYRGQPVKVWANQTIRFKLS